MSYTKLILFCIGIAIVGWLGVRHLITIFIGYSQDGSLKPGQRLCHATSSLLLMGSIVIAVIFKAWWLLLVGVISEYLFRRFTIWTGGKFPLDEKEKQMSTKEFIKHIATKENTNDKV